MTQPTCPVDWLHVSFALAMLFSLQDFSWKKKKKKKKNENGFRVQSLPSCSQNRRRHWLTRLQLLSDRGSTGLTVETLHCRRRTPLIEEAKMVKRESNRNQGETRVNRVRSVKCFVKVCSPSYRADCSKPVFF